MKLWIVLSLICVVIALGCSQAMPAASRIRVNEHVDVDKEFSEGFMNSFLFKSIPFPGEKKPKTGGDVPLPPQPAYLDLQPVVIVPALMGSNLWMTMDNAERRPFYCPTSTHGKSYLAWLAYDKLYIPGYFECWMSHLNFTSYDPVNREYIPPTGVNISIIDYGASVASVDFLDPTTQNIPLWHDIISTLNATGYVVGENLFSAPYDFRLGPDSPEYIHQFNALQELIETAAQKNNKPVVLISLSMGCPYTHLFLTSHVSQEWKDQYISSFVSYSGVYAGSTIAVDTILGGGNYAAKYPSVREAIKYFTRTWGSINWLVPPVDFWGNQTVATLAGQNYSTADYIELFELFNAPNSIEIRKNVANYTTLQDPGVKVYCYYGYNTSTEFITHYNSTSSASYYTYKDGDNTAVVESLGVCQSWSNVTVIPVANMQHAEFVTDPYTINQLIEILTNQPVNFTRPAIPPGGISM